MNLQKAIQTQPNALEKPKLALGVKELRPNRMAGVTSIRQKAVN